MWSLNHILNLWKILLIEMIFLKIVCTVFSHGIWLYCSFFRHACMKIVEFWWSFTVFQRETYNCFLLLICCRNALFEHFCSVWNMLLPQPASPILVFYVNSGTPPYHWLLKPTGWKFGVLKLILCLILIARPFKFLAKLVVSRAFSWYPSKFEILHEQEKRRFFGLNFNPIYDVFSIWIGPLLEEIESYFTRRCGPQNKVSARPTSLRRPIRVVNRLPRVPRHPTLRLGS